MSLPPIISDLQQREQSLPQWIRALSFWSTIVLPVLYIPLFVTGLDTVTRSVVFFGLFSLNIVTLVISHSYRPE